MIRKRNIQTIIAKFLILISFVITLVACSNNQKQSNTSSKGQMVLEEKSQLKFFQQEIIMKT